uniref:Uncharacterized protein n=1 Tax=Moniliophthora roreri TaxID=221103 RepID=A0A0W0F9Q9_MONRR
MHLFVFIHNEATTRRFIIYFPFGGFGDTWSQAIQRAQEVGGLSSDYLAPIPGNRWDGPPTLPNLDPVRYSIETEQDVQVRNEGVLDIVTLNGANDPFGVGPSDREHVRRSRNFNFDGNDKSSLGSRVIGSSGNIVQDHEPGMDGGNAQPWLGKGDNVKELDADERTDGILGDSDNVGDVRGDSDSLRR